MTDSYLAVVGSRGVVRLVEETEHAARFLAQRCYRAAPYREALWWATLPPQAAETIRFLINAGLYRLAMERLAKEALQHGSILPPESDDTKNRPAA